MNLREYLFRQRISVQDFAEKLEYSRTHLSLIVNGKGKPSPRLAKSIERATNGEVTAQELLKGKGNAGE